jgi:hypothetical protein
MPSNVTPAQMQQLLPLACAWAGAQEQRILAEGEPLSTQQCEDAKAAGVSHPDRVRVLALPRIPMPEEPALRTAAEATGLISPHTGGMSLRYGIFVRADCAGDRALLVHELVHTAQYERLGGFPEFLSQYLLECLTIGYPAAPMEQEAILTAARICGQ